MPITLKHGSIFDSTAQVLVCPVNCVGVMGKGLALEFKRRWPGMFEWYASLCRSVGVSKIDPGETRHWCAHERYVILAATKKHWRDPSKVEWVNSCLFELASEFAVRDITSIAIPQLGCGCGGLDWTDVWPLYEKHLGGLDCDVEVWIYEHRQ